MWKQTDRSKLRVASFNELDALVGKHITKVSPKIFWEEQHASFRFESLQEAEDALSDPYFLPFLPDQETRAASFVEVREFPSYSLEISEALKVVERLTGDGEALQIRCENRHWVAAFGDETPVSANSAAIAICLAGLSAKGIHVDFVPGWTAGSARSCAAA